MKKKVLKKESAVGLLFILMLSLAACSKERVTESSGDLSGRNGETQVDDDIEKDTKDYLYVSESFPLEDVEYVNTACGSGKGIYIAAPFYDDETKTSGTQFFYVEAQGMLQKLPLQYVNGEADSINVDAMGVLSDGSLVYIKREVTVTDVETWEGTNRFFLVHASAESGEEISCVDITEQLQFNGEGGNYFLQFLNVDKEDHIYLSEGKRIWVLDLNGKTVFPVATDTGSWIQDMGVTKEGRVVYSGWDNAAGGRCLFVIDETSGTLTLCKENVPEAAGFNSMAPADETGVLINTLQGLAEYDIQSRTSRSVLNWADNAMNSNSVAEYTVLDDGNILVISQDFAEAEGSPKWHSVLLIRVPAGEVHTQEKEILSLGIFEENTALLQAVYAFNQSQEVYQIQVVNYGEGDGSEADITHFINELIAGTGPDMFELSKLDLNRFARKGILEELTPYMEEDGRINREDYFESVLNAYAVDGRLYTIPNSFIVRGMVGSSSYLENCGEGYAWTLRDIMNLAEINPDKELFGYGSKNYVLLNCMSYNYSMFIDWNNGECNLNSEAFVELLEFANRFPDQYEQRKNDYSVTDKILNGTLMADEVSFSSIQDYQVWEGLFGEDFIIKGFPAVEGTGLVVEGNNLLAINAKSECKEAAWKFLSSLLTKEYYQNEKVDGFPTLIQAYDRINEEYITPEYDMDEDGDKTERSKGSFSIGDFSVEFRTSTKEEAEQMTDVIQHCDRAAFDDKQLMKIVQEEAAAYFEGLKTAQETAEIIQSRARMYVNESY